VLQEPALRVRGSVRVTPETLIVGAHNHAALERARTRLARETALPQAMLSYRVWQPEEVDGPVKPPRAAYLAVLDTIAAVPSERPHPFVINLASLPPTVGEDELRRRRLPWGGPTDSCGAPTIVSFQQIRQYVSGRYVFSLAWRLNDYSYVVDCTSGLCRVTRVGQLAGDKMAVCRPGIPVGSDRRRRGR
jgi:hypothetical protein